MYLYCISPVFLIIRIGKLDVRYIEAQYYSDLIASNETIMKEQTGQCTDVELRSKLENNTMDILQDIKNGSRTVQSESDNWQKKFNSNSMTKCEVHDTVMLYCMDCLGVVCGQCEAVHSSHAMITLCEASKINKAKINCELSNVKSLIRYATHVSKDLHSYLEKLGVNLAEITSDILQRSADLAEGADLLTATLISDIENEHDTESNRIHDKISEFDNFIASAKAIAVNCENLSNAIDPKYVIVKGNAELSCVANLVTSLPVCLAEKCIYVLSPVLTTKENETSVEERLGEFTKVHVPWRIEVKRIGSIRPEAVASSRFVTTMCPDSEERVWVCWQWGPNIHLVDKDGNVKKTVGVGCKVDDICKNNDYLVVSSHETKCIKIFDSNYKHVKTLDTEKVPRGVYSSCENELVLCCVQNLHHRNGDKSSLVKLGVNDGDIKDLHCCEHLIQPWRVAVNLNGDICVSDRNKGAVMIFDKEGRLKATYNSSDSTTRHPFAPHAICCDMFGQILVVDYVNHTVHVLDPLGRFRGFLIMDTELEKRAIYMGTSSPFSITIDSVGDVWVGNKFGYLTILKYLI